MTPFDYPAEPHRRRHGPAGYADLESFRPWLRDEFAFRCVYCLRRERWEPGRTAFEIDHLVPVAGAPDLARTYDNLLYTCDVCNSVKGVRLLPDPGLALLAGDVAVEADGRIVGRSRDARRMIRVLGLDDAEFTAYRARWIRIAVLSRERDPTLFGQLMGYPDDLPDLSVRRPPGGNARPEGIDASYFRRRERGELPATY
ncbi:MAG TPA: HNH endonuclease signature motif containing protein [Gemmataceae bacterium]|nr:HNH endonuclease signature motif containing protein [Gemmataceae bacterium]